MPIIKKHTVNPTKTTNLISIKVASIVRYTFLLLIAGTSFVVISTKINKRGQPWKVENKKRDVGSENNLIKKSVVRDQGTEFRVQENAVESDLDIGH